MVTEDYVSFETAKLLKEKGFDCATLHYYYDKDGDLLFSAWRVDAGKNEFIAPTLQMAMKWLREVHNIHIAFTWCSSYRGNNLFSYHIDKMNDVAYNGYDSDEEYTYKEACEAAIKYCLENLI